MWITTYNSDGILQKRARFLVIYLQASRFRLPWWGVQNCEMAECGPPGKENMLLTALSKEVRSDNYEQYIPFLNAHAEAYLLESVILKYEKCNIQDVYDASRAISFISLQRALRYHYWWKPIELSCKIATACSGHADREKNLLMLLNRGSRQNLFTTRSTVRGGRLG